MPRLILILVGFILSSFIKKILVGAGLGIVTYNFLTYVFDQFMHHVFISHYGVFSGLAVTFMKLSGLDQALSIILSAYTVLIGIKALGVSLAR
ncbi:DUF2523 family protein [Acinetobacter towneri]|uniref:DUF2523 family protein n=1 Tax=Acinetobacter towneri TaxID=202956 RepID=UPI002097FC23|nr:DUF2523 family protein [Acinetobacter towneri]MCO8058163.1 DUF2523 domain-containing protein [Acinetobacter towneri]MCO8063810.1 DUF2523 domain-containing protein [Acinetobacter towneri]